MPLDQALPLIGDGFRTQRTLAEHPGEWVNLECLKCDRTGRLSKARLLAEHGPHMGLVDLINRLAPKDCPLNVNDAENVNRCGACYGDLI